MNFKTKLFLTYSALIITLVVILGAIFYRYGSVTIENSACSNLTVVSGKMSQQLDNLINQMDFVTSYLLSNSKVITALSIFADLDPDDPQNLVYINEAKVDINNSMITYYLDKNYYRVNMFDKKGYFFTSNYRLKGIESNISNLMNSLAWIGQADRAKGGTVVIPPYFDPWNTSEKVKVFGLARAVLGGKNERGYIEVQESYSELEKILSIPDGKDIVVIAVKNSGEILYDGGIHDKKLLEYYSKISDHLENPMLNASNPVNGEMEIIAGAKSSSTGIKILIAQQKDTLLGPLRIMRTVTLVIGILTIVFSIGYIYIFSRRLTKPIRQLKENMEKTELSNLLDITAFERSNNEIEALNKSYHHLLERINLAVSREIKANSLQIMASFDSLQAQVNPHFLYNILNVLSSKGITTGDEEICEICDGIAAMLRYSTSTLERSATIADELAHVGNYLLLMKKRYEHKLEFDIDVEQTIMNEPIPKIILQQIVENSINHGFDMFQYTMKINILGYTSKECWFIEITDNGQGFDASILEELEAKMMEMKALIANVEPVTGTQIGGLGLINTYGRLLLFYQDELYFNLQNSETGGAKVIIGSRIKAVNGGENSGCGQ